MTYNADKVLSDISSDGFQTELHKHKPVQTVEEMTEECGHIDGVHTKNLFLRDNKKNFFLVTLPHDAKVDLKGLRSVLGAKGGLSFASSESLESHLGVISGAVSPLAAVNDDDCIVAVYIEQSLLGADRINIHPLSNAMTLSIRPDDLVSYLARRGRKPLSFSLPSTGPAPAQMD
ncbi:prolyl-tRNA synthetase associated domain-containing protein [Methylobacterium sp. P31]